MTGRKVVAGTAGVMFGLCLAVGVCVAQDTPVQQFGLGQVESVAFSSDGTKALVGGVNATLFDVSTGGPLRVFFGTGQAVHSVAFSPDGAQTLTGTDDGLARLWDAATGEEIRTFSGHPTDVRSVAFSPDGTQVLTGSDDRSAKLWNAATGAEIRTFSGHTGIVYSVAFSPNGTQVLTGSADQSAKLWDATTGAEIRTFSGHTGSVLSVAFSFDGTQVLTGSADTTAKLWNATTGAEIRTFSGHSSTIRSVAISSDGTRVLTGATNSSAKLWDAATGAEIRTLLHQGNVTAVAISPGGTQVLTGSSLGTAKLWDTATGAEIRAFLGLTAPGGYQAVLSPDGTKVLMGSGAREPMFWDTATGVVIRTFPGHTGQVVSVAFSPDGTQVLTGSWDSTAKLWNAATGTEIRTFSGHADDIDSVAFSPDGSQVLTGSADYTAKLWDAATGAEIRTFSGHTFWVGSVAFSPDGTQVVTGSRDQTAKLWDAATGAEIRTFSGHTGDVRSVAFSPDGLQVLTGSNDGTARLWDTATGAEIRTFSGHTNVVWSVAFSPYGTVVLTGSDDHTAKLWDTATGTEIRTLSGHASFVRSVAFSHDGAQVLTGSTDGTAMLWQLETAGPSRLQTAMLSDLDRNGVDSGDQLALTLSRSVILTTTVLQSHFFLPVAGDSLGGSGFAATLSPFNSRRLVLTLGSGAVLTPTGQFSTATLTPGAPTGIDFASSPPSVAIRNRDGVAVAPGGVVGVDDSGVDVAFTLVSGQRDIGPPGGSVSVVASPDATYTRHELAIPAGALATTKTFALIVPDVNLGVTNAVQALSSDPGVTFAQSATIKVEYVEGDIDWELGQIEAEMRVHQLVENPTGVFQYIPVPGPRRLESLPGPEGAIGIRRQATRYRSVSADIDNLDPLESPGRNGIFAGLPVETVDTQRATIGPVGGGPGIVKGQEGFILRPGPRSAYVLHSIEFPGWEETTEANPDRLVVTIRTAWLAERLSQTGGQSFPSQSGAVFTVTVEDATSQPVVFPDPVHITVQFKERGGLADTDCLQFDGAPSDPHNMRLVRDELPGKAVDFAVLEGVAQQLDIGLGIVSARNVMDLTGSEGQGTWGTAAAPLLPSLTAVHWSLYK